MPDITMCRGTGCEKAQECFRHRAAPNPHRQSYFSREPLDENGDCKYFAPIQPGYELAENDDEVGN